MFVEFAGRTVVLHLCNEFDVARLIIFDDFANGTRVLSDKVDYFRNEFVVGVKPKDFETPHDACVRIVVSQLLKERAFFFGIPAVSFVFLPTARRIL